MKPTKLISLIIITIVCASLNCKAAEPLPPAKVISIFMRDDNVDVNNNYVVNFFIGEFSRFIESKNIQVVYSKSMKNVCGGWYASLEFNGRTYIKENGKYRYKYTDVNIYFYNPNSDEESYLVELDDLDTGTKPGNLLDIFRQKLK